MTARGRGVDVKIIVPGISDIWIIQRAAEAAYRRWMAAGLELWEYQSVVMHSKYAVVDDDWCLIGTFNANVASVVFAIEVALVSHQPAEVSDAAAQMERDLARSRLVEGVAIGRVGFFRTVVSNVARMMMVLANLIFHRKPVPLPPVSKLK